LLLIPAPHVVILSGDGKRFTPIQRAANRLKQPPPLFFSPNQRPTPLKKGVYKLCILAYRLRPFASDDSNQLFIVQIKTKGDKWNWRMREVKETVKWVTLKKLDRSLALKITSRHAP
jgi:hypothetical protein